MKKDDINQNVQTPSNIINIVSISYQRRIEANCVEKKLAHCVLLKSDEDVFVCFRQC